MVIPVESPIVTLFFSLLVAVIVDSQLNVNRLPPGFSSLRRPPPPPISPPLHLPFIPRPRLLQPPPPSFVRPPHPLQSPPLSSSPPPPPPPPPPRRYLHPALPEHGHHNSHRNLSPPLEIQKPNVGKKIGLMFIGVATILQVCVVAFLLIRRRQFL